MMGVVIWRHRSKVVAALFVCVTLTGIFYLSLPDGAMSREDRLTRKLDMVYNGHRASPSITIIIRDFEHFGNSLAETVNSIQTNLGTGVDILVVADDLPYPPVKFSSSPSAQILSLAPDLSKNYSLTCPLHFVKTRFVLFVPDGVRVDGWDNIKGAIELLDSRDNVKAVAIPAGKDKLECSPLDVNLKEWTVTFGETSSTVKNVSYCSYIIGGVHSLLFHTHTLHSMAEPFSRPFPFSFYLQASLKGWNVHILKDRGFKTFKDMFKDFRAKWKRKQFELERLQQFYRRVGIKREILKSGESNYFGCEKDTERCFGSVHHDMPAYLYQGKWTPPCCLQALRETAAHVFGVLDKCSARYWLEGGSLLGAARHGDIIPWDYDVDIGIYRNDLDLCQPLKRADQESFIDEKGFVWEKASEGEFYRVQYSKSNRLHVDIFPFYSKDGTMTKNTWFATHRQDTEFPESFLLPLTRIKFAGIEASAPNNVREFLEFKFGKGVIENPKYPNLQPAVL